MAPRNKKKPRKMGKKMFWTGQKLETKKKKKRDSEEGK